jgi:iron(III) transport system ATP-binding protein
MTSHLKLENLTHRYGHQLTFENINLEVQAGEIFCLLGPSGCGKSTLLGCIAGFHDIESGEIYLSQNQLTHTRPENRNIAMVFQDYALFPHLSVFKNISYGLMDIAREKHEAIVQEMLELVKLPNLSSKYPHEISGGEQQRVSIARALARSSQLILLDEPFSNLDPERRRELRFELKELLHQRGLTAIFVTHDQQEAFELADKIAVMNNGKIHQVATPQEVYHQPLTYFVADFLGSRLFIPARVIGLDTVDTPLGVLNFRMNALDYPVGTELFLYVPKNALTLEKTPLSLSLDFQVKRENFLGEFKSFLLESTITPFLNHEFVNQTPFKRGDTINLYLNLELLTRAFKRN